MTENEIDDAVCALIDWFEDQGISMFDAIRIVGVLLTQIHIAADKPEEVG